MNKHTYEESCSIRDSYRILPLQGIWTWITGKEVYGRKTLWKSSSLECVLWSISWVILGLVLTYYSYEKLHEIKYLLLYLVGVLFSASGARYIVATIIHHGVHQHLFKKGYLNRVVCEVLSTIFIIQPYDSYKQFHVYEHHGKNFSTLDDKDLSAIYKLGFTPGKSLNQMYLNLLKVLLNPFLHLSFLVGRIKSNFIDVPIYRLIMSSIWLVSLALLCFNQGALFSILVIIIPFVFVYQIASILHLITEHRWVIRNKDMPVRESHLNNCLARFCGERCPENFNLSNLHLWLFWSSKHIFVHLPIRMLIVQGSLVCHDWHHRFGGEKRWYLYAQLREIDAKKLHDANEFNYVETWGFSNSLNYVFEELANEPILCDQQSNDLKYRLN